MLITILSVFNACALLVMIVFLYIFKRSIPILLQDALNDVGAQLNEMFKNPQVSRAMSVLGKKSGEARAATALRNKAAKAMIGQTPALGMIAKQLGFTELEAVSLMNDPMFGPLIQKGIGMAQKALSGAAGGSFPSGSSSGSFRGYGREE